MEVMNRKRISSRPPCYGVERLSPDALKSVPAAYHIQKIAVGRPPGSKIEILADRDPVLSSRNLSIVVGGYPKRTLLSLRGIEGDPALVGRNLRIVDRQRRV